MPIERPCSPVAVLALIGLLPLMASPGSEVTARYVQPAAVMLPLPVRYQQLYRSSCETAAAHIALAMLGRDLSERALIAELPTDRRPAVYDAHGSVVRWGDPYRDFVGDIQQGGGWPLKGYGVYAPPILALLRRHGLSHSYGGSWLSINTIRQALASGKPVIVWLPKLSLYRYAVTLQRFYWHTWQGHRVAWNEMEHAQVVVGYDASGFYVDNPDYQHYSDGHWLWHYSWSDFERGWQVLENQAIVVSA